MAIDLTSPSPDTATILRQWLAVYKDHSLAPAGGFFAANINDAEREIVEYTAGIVAAGTAYYKVGDVTPSLLRLARKLNAFNKFMLYPVFASALLTGLPTFAMSIGVKSESCVGSTGPGSV
jgi:hypothetical protein